MTISTTITAGRSAGNNNLHGTLRFLSKKYCLKSNKRRSSNKIQRRARASPHSSCGFRPTIRKSSNPRSDRFQVSSIVNDNDNGEVNDNDNGNGEDKRDIAEGKGSSSPDIEVKAEKSAAAVLANDNASVGASDKIDDSGLRGKQAEKRKNVASTRTKTTTKLLHPEDLARYHEAEDVQKQALKKIERARRTVYNDQVQHVWGVYMYGLKHVLALNDLSDAPDAILPGNF